MSAPVRPFRLDVPQAALDDLHRRLDRARWPEKETVTDWSQGTPLAALQELCAYWRDDYDWRRCEARLN
ncbi:MAG TPA: epoxide hydrolase N-terminal domain-containing protein, partial [Reyranella sp.]|nr:epoxide hydrolase N-terminal domain-containing protein [Reyranella sp.]